MTEIQNELTEDSQTYCHHPAPFDMQFWDGWMSCPELFVEQFPLFMIGRGWHDLRAWTVFHEGSRHPIPDLHLWAQNNFIGRGAQFKSNRRRH